MTKPAAKPPAKTTRVRIVQPVPPPLELDIDGAGGDDEAFIPDADELALDALREDDADAELMVKIYRVGPGGLKDLTICGEMPIADYSEILLTRPPYGGGTFRVVARSRTSGLKYNRQRKAQRDQAAYDALEPLANSVTGAAPMSEARMVELINATVRAAQPQGASRSEVMAEFRGMAEIFSSLMAPRGESPGNGAPGMRDMIGTMKDIAELGRTLNPQTPVDESGRPDRIMGVILDKGLTLVTTAMQARAAQAPAGAAPPPATPALPAPPLNATPETDPVKLKFLLEFALERACNYAKAGAPPADYADEIYDDIPDEVLDSMEGSPDWFEQLCAITPDCKLYAPWFEQVRAELMKIHKEEAEPPELTGGAPGAHTVAESLPGNANGSSVSGNGGGKPAG